MVAVATILPEFSLRFGAVRQEMKKTNGAMTVLFSIQSFDGIAFAPFDSIA